MEILISNLFLKALAGKLIWEKANMTQAFIQGLDSTLMDRAGMRVSGSQS